MQYFQDVLGDGSKIIVCPVCGFEYNHFKGFLNVAGNDNYEAWSGGKGDLQSLSFYCENGHKWELCIGFHKGYSFIFRRQILD